MKIQCLPCNNKKKLFKFCGSFTYGSERRKSESSEAKLCLN